MSRRETDPAGLKDTLSGIDSSTAQVRKHEVASMDKEIRDVTLEVLISIRDEIRGLREDTNRRFEEVYRRFELIDQRFEAIDRRFEAMDRRFEAMDRRFEAMETDLSHIRQILKRFVAHFERDHLILAGEVDDLKRRLQVCEERLGISS